MPLVAAHPDQHAAQNADKPSPTATAPVALAGPTLTAPEHADGAGQDTDEAQGSGAVRRQLDRTTLLAGALGGFVGGAVSGAAVTALLG